MKLLSIVSMAEPSGIVSAIALIGAGVRSRSRPHFLEALGEVGDEAIGDAGQR